MQAIYVGPKAPHFPIATSMIQDGGVFTPNNFGNDVYPVSYTHLDVYKRQEISIVLNGKHTNQKMVFDALSNIHQALTKTKQYPGTDDFQVMNIATISAPQLIGREENSQILYGSSLGVKFYWR